MTDLTLADIAGNVDDEGTRRDGHGRYLIEGRAWTRVSTILDELDNKASLVSWQAAMTVNGLLSDVELAERVTTFWLEHDGDPWYASLAAKKEAKRLLEALAVAGGSKRSAVHGTNVHALSAAHDTGAAVSPASPHHAEWLDGYASALDAAGVKIDPEHVERIVVLDRFGVAGTYDRGRCLVPGFGEALLGDLKTGGSLEWGRSKIAMQLGAYVNADAVIELGAAAEGSEDRRHPMPEISRTHALVIHAPFDRPGEVNFHVVRADAGWQGFELAIAKREWSKGPASTWEPLPGELEAKLVESLGMPALAAIAASLDALSVPALARQWLQERIDVIGAHSAARDRLSRTWPKGVPPLRASTDHTVEQLDEIERVLDRVEAEHSIPFGPPCPGRIETDQGGRWLERLRSAFPGSIPNTQGAQNHE